MAFEGCSSPTGARLMSALIVERNNCVRYHHTILFKNRGFDTYVVTTGEEAIDLIYSGKKFDVIVMGMTLPMMNSVQATRKLRIMGVDKMIIGTEVKGYLTYDNNNCYEVGLDRIYELPLTREIVASLHNELMGHN
ncbi:hypothetical protein POM88_004020 [Heracleum sosnowskyi]|uniref:Response regulatory domain-containing protein n=1 Tax=Heracleum sosnowskyi TaxID=360622 RepID=A0AAD8N7A8_9APIA|nr:hypothetical protein POM88_004020 [Heracleum sosnowskyi]